MSLQSFPSPSTGHTSGRSNKRAYVEARAIHGTVQWWRRDEMDCELQSRRLTRLHHADDGAQIAARRVVGRKGRAREQDYRNVSQPVAFLHDSAKVLARDLGAFHFGDDYVVDLAAENVERLLRCGHEDHLIAVVLKQVAHRLRHAGVGLDSQYSHFAGEWRRCPRPIWIVAISLLILHRNAEAKVGRQRASNYLCLLCEVEGRRFIRIGKHHFKCFSYPISSAGSGE